MAVITALAFHTLLVFTAADVACSESGTNYDDGACVLQVARNRLDVWGGRGRYKDNNLYDVLMQPSQHAHGCRIPITLQHIKLGLKFALGRLDVPAFCRRALWYCGNYDSPRCLTRKGTRPVGRVLHVFMGPT